MDYLLKSSICMATFYGLYYFGFRRLSFHVLNRFYLLASLALSLAIPMLSYEREEVVIVEPSPTSEITYSEETPIQVFDNQALVSPPQVMEYQSIEIDWMQILTMIYLLGVTIMLLLFFRNLILIVRMLVSSPSFTSTSLIERTQLLLSERIRVLVTERSRGNASFFNYIFLNPENLNPHEQALIIAHESFHAKQLHTLDLVLLGILKAIFWFNPIVYFYQKSLKQIHEYEVDALMSASHDSQDYAHLLLKLGVGTNSLTINQFSTKPLSNRIQFLFRKPTKNMKKLLYFLSIPIIGIGIMAFAQEKVKRVYKEKEGQKVVQIPIPAQSPLKVFYKNTYGMKLSSLSDFTERNMTVNDLFLLPAATYYYVNPNFLTLETIKEVNLKIKNRGYEIIINEKENDLQNNLTKLSLSIKNLKTKKTTEAREIDMSRAKEVGKQGAWLFFEIYKNHFQDSDVILTEGSSDLEVNVGEKIATTYINVTSSLRIAKKEIVYKVSPDRFNLKTFEKVKEYFAKENFTLTSKNEIYDKNNKLISLTIQLENGKEKTEKQLILNDLRYLVKSRTINNDKARRQDETLVIEANKDTKAIKIIQDGRWLDMFRKSGKFEIMKVTSNETHSQIDSTKFTYYLSVKPKKGNIDSFKVIVNNHSLVEGRDFIVKGEGIYLDQRYKGTRPSFHVYSTAMGPVLYPYLTKLDEIPLIKINLSSTLPSFFASNDNKTLSKPIKIPFPDARPIKSQDTLRTIVEANRLGKNPLVIINGEEYPSSILTRIDPTKFGWSYIAKPNDEKAIAKYGSKAKDGFIEIRTIDDFLFKDEKTHQIAVENVRKQLEPSTKRVKRLILKDANGKEYEKVSIMRLDGENVQFSVTVPVGGKILFLINNKVVSEEEVNKSTQYFRSGGCGAMNEERILKYGESYRKYDAYIYLETQ